MVIPSIDLMKGKAVQLVQGKELALERDNPIGLAREFSRYGEMAVIDLDAACGNGCNDQVIKEICRIADCRVGGGIRSVEDAKKMISLGAEKIIVGSPVFEGNVVNHQFLEDLNKTIGKERVIIAIDAFNREVVVRGWTHKTGLNIFNVLKDLESHTSEFLFTCVEKEGGMKGTDLGTIQTLRESTRINLTVAGGISTLDEIKKLSHLGVHMQLGMAIYTGKIALGDAFIAALKWDRELIPAITIDLSSQVLMQAYVSEKSLKRTFETGKVWYYSRSRKKLWMKGETSGHVQFFKKIRTDCDGDSVLITVNQKGYACHTGSYSCFGGKFFSLNELSDVIIKRIKDSPKDSYTARLSETVLRKKILEEAQELVEAQGEEEIIWETSDLLYFITVLLVKGGVSVEQVLNELKRRRRSPR